LRPISVYDKSFSIVNCLSKNTQGKTSSKSTKSRKQNFSIKEKEIIVHELSAASTRAFSNAAVRTHTSVQFELFFLV
jgi:hypothetical protein